MTSLIAKPVTAEAMKSIKLKLRDSLLQEANDFSKWGGYSLDHFFNKAVEYVLKHDSDWKKYKKKLQEI